MAVKAINNIVDLDGFVLILLIFRAYPHIHNMNSPVSTIIQRGTPIKKTIEQIRKFRAKNQVMDALNI